LAQKPKVLRKIRDDFKQYVKANKIETTGQKKAEFLKKNLNMEMIHDLEYINWAMMEALRIQPPAPNTSTLILS
jgi:cytochrome P450